jgi:hypothetical protein
LGTTRTCLIDETVNASHGARSTATTLLSSIFPYDVWSPVWNRHHFVVMLVFLSIGGLTQRKHLDGSGPQWAYRDSLRLCLLSPTDDVVARAWWVQQHDRIGRISLLSVHRTAHEDYDDAANDRLIMTGADIIERWCRRSSAPPLFQCWKISICFSLALSSRPFVTLLRARAAWGRIRGTRGSAPRCWGSRDTQSSG